MESITRQLSKEVTRIKRNFLPSKASRDPTSPYSNRKADRMRACWILVHAEIEECIERLCLEKIDESLSKWVNDGKVSRPILGLVAAYAIGWKDRESEENQMPIRLAANGNEDAELNSIILKAVKNYKDIIKGNNGIKKKNIKMMVLPLGIALSDLDDVWLSDMDAFGGIRGGFAHSSRPSINRAIDPDALEASINSLVAGIKDLKNVISSL